jgi:hypothetical protein
MTQIYIEPVKSLAATHGSYRLFDDINHSDFVIELEFGIGLWNFCRKNNNQVKT